MKPLKKTRSTARTDKAVHKVAAKIQRQTVQRCHVCSCTQEMGCPVGCGWATPNLCTTCAELRRALDEFRDAALRPSLAGIVRLWKEVTGGQIIEH